MVSVSCPSCKFETTQFKEKHYPAIDEITEGIPTHILTCTECGFEFAYPMPSEKELYQFYQNNQYWGNLVEPIVCPKIFPVLFALAETRWELLVSYLPELEKESIINILDIGAGHGCFGMVASTYLSKHKIHYTVVEPDQMMRDSLSKAWVNVNSEIQLSLYDSLDKIKQKFHIIVLSHVLEHVTKPVEFLKNLHDFYELDGILFIDVPNQDYSFKKNVFPHLLFFSPENLESTIENSGYIINTVGGWGRGRKNTPLNGNMFTFLHFISNVMTKLQRIIPARMLMTYFSWYFGIKKKNPKGTWVRAIAKLKKRE